MTSSNVRTYQKLITNYVNIYFKKGINKHAVKYLITEASRIAQHQKRLTSNFELLADMIQQARAFLGHDKCLDRDTLQKVSDAQHQRECRLEEQLIRDIKNDLILIDTHNAHVGQINALTILSIGGHSFGAPSKISAQTYVGKEGVINIEKQTQMAGPLQHKSTLILEGYLKGTFAQDFPLCCGVSLAFEQSYGGVDGDSASLAELIAIISSLSKMPIRQEIAITGSMNQFGQAQSVGGIHTKIEGYYRLCCEKGLTGQQGVIIPKSNLYHLTLKSSVQRAIDNKKFHIYPVDHVIDAINILMKPERSMIKTRDFFQNVICSKVYEQLKTYHDIMKKHT